MRRSRKLDQLDPASFWGHQLVSQYFTEGRGDPIAFRGCPYYRCIQMAFLWRTDDGLARNAGCVVL